MFRSKEIDCNLEHLKLTSHAISMSHLKRSNAIRLKTRNIDILKLSLKNFQSTVVKNGLNNLQENEDEEDDDVEPSTLLEEIKRGVRLHPVSGGLKDRDFKRIRAQLNGESLIYEDEHQSDLPLSDILARVLAKRNQVMQQTDDESELSSIDSQPEFYEKVSDSYCSQSGTMIVTLYDDQPKRQNYNQQNVSTQHKLSDSHQIGHYHHHHWVNGRVDLIIKL